MTFFIRTLLLSLLALSCSVSNAYASRDYASGAALRYFQFTQADEAADMIGVAYAIKKGAWLGSIEIGAPRSTTQLGEDSTGDSLGEIDLFVNTSVGWQTPLVGPTAFRAELGIGSYVVTRSRFSGGFLTIKTDNVRTLEPRLSLVFNANDKFDVALFGGILLGTDSLSEPTAGALVRVFFF